jgi:hypothetical protein
MIGILDGARRWVSSSRWIAVLAPTLLMLPLAVYGLFGVLAPAYDLPRRVSDPTLLVGESDHAADVRWLGGKIRLIGFQIAPQVVKPGETVFVTLCWQSGGGIDENLPYAVHIVDENNGKIGARNTHPGLGMYATSYWQPGDAFCDRVRVAVNADAPTLKTYRVVLSYFHEETVAQVPALLDNGDEVNVVALGEIGVAPRIWPAASAERGAGSYYEFGGLIGLRIESETHLTWIALRGVGRDYILFIHVLNSSNELVAQSDEPLGDDFPGRFWLRGTILADTLALSGGMPGNVGVYRLRIGLYDPMTMERLPVTGSGKYPVIDNTIEVSRIVVVD